VHANGEGGAHARERGGACTQWGGSAGGGRAHANREGSAHIHANGERRGGGRAHANGERGGVRT
jgi:hypothetical protein